MGETPPPLTPNALSRIGIVGAALGGLGIFIFLLLWFLLGEAGIDDFPRMVIALCAPPGLLAGVIGIYFLLSRNNQTS
jgi:lipopolysaccharide export LptBFGC system permease protein LptF